MKLCSDVLVEIVNIVRVGILEERDISQLLRDLDLEEKDVDGQKKLGLSEDYLLSTGRR